MRGTFPLDVSAEERAFGFSVRVTKKGDTLVVVDLADGLCAVKRCNEQDQIEYIVCDALLNHLYPSALSVAELKERFLRPRHPPS